MRPAVPRRASVPFAATAAVAMAVFVAACERPAPRTPVTTAPGAGGPSGSAPEASGALPARAARPPLPDAADLGGNKVRDVAISTEVRTRLSRDPVLAAASINVDTAGGRVVLRGSAPDTGARGRAAELARSVDGVLAVENELNVQPRP